MAKFIDIEFVKTYATKANAEKAVCKVLGNDHRERNELTYTILPVETDKGIRYGVLFIGASAATHGIHFHFNLVG